MCPGNKSESFHGNGSSQRVSVPQNDGTDTLFVSGWHFVVMACCVLCNVRAEVEERVENR
jgi:hypothetical protein